MIVYIIFICIFAIIYLNIAPLIYADTFGHYIIPITRHYIHSEKDGNGNITIYNDIVEMAYTEEKCNPWLMFWHLTKIKPPVTEWEFDSEETKEIWNKISNN